MQQEESAWQMLALFLNLMFKYRYGLSLAIFILLSQLRINAQRDIVKDYFIGKLVP